MMTRAVVACAVLLCAIALVHSTTVTPTPFPSPSRGGQTSSYSISIQKTGSSSCTICGTTYSCTSWATYHPPWNPTCFNSTTPSGYTTTGIRIAATGLWDCGELPSTMSFTGNGFGNWGSISVQSSSTGCACYTSASNCATYATQVVTPTNFVENGLNCIDVVMDHQGVACISEFVVSLQVERYSTPSPTPSPTPHVVSEDCNVILYTGGQSCKAVTPNSCITCYANGVSYYYKVNCTSPTTQTGECTCHQYQYSHSDCSGTVIGSTLENHSCDYLNGTFSDNSVCLFTTEVVHDYEINLYHSDPGVTAPVCMSQSSFHCYPCTVNGITSYYSATCDDTLNEYACNLYIYPDTECLLHPVEIPLNHLDCTQLGRQFGSEAACAFSYTDVNSQDTSRRSTVSRDQSSLRPSPLQSSSAPATSTTLDGIRRADVF